MAHILITGFPGFLASALVDKLVQRLHQDDSVTCLVENRFFSLAQEKIREIESRNPLWINRITLAIGDISQPAKNWSLRSQSISEIFHFAALYDLRVPFEVGLRINVIGTKNILDLARAQTHFKRFHFISTCYVSGRHAGAFTEAMLHHENPFNNFYEQTKYLSEVEVQRAMALGLPSTIYRPSIVVGDSHSGETQKFDGIYFAMLWALRWRHFVPIFSFGNFKNFYINVVPRDFVVEAIDFLSRLGVSAGKTYQLCDPSPCSIKEFFEVLEDVSNRNFVRVPSTPALTKALFRTPGLSKFINIPSETVDYFTHPTRYECNNTMIDLRGSGIGCPKFENYVSPLFRFLEETQVNRLCQTDQSLSWPGIDTIKLEQHLILTTKE